MTTKTAPLVVLTVKSDSVPPRLQTSNAHIKQGKCTKAVSVSSFDQISEIYVFYHRQVP